MWLLIKPTNTHTHTMQTGNIGRKWMIPKTASKQISKFNKIYLFMLSESFVFCSLYANWTIFLCMLLAWLGSARLWLWLWLWLGTFLSPRFQFNRKRDSILIYSFHRTNSWHNRLILYSIMWSAPVFFPSHHVSFVFSLKTHRMKNSISEFFFVVYLFCFFFL